ncbi:MAG: hypothetical protein WA542_06765, partial [Candidatus Acidiferrum sp.]
NDDLLFRQVLHAQWVGESHHQMSMALVSRGSVGVSETVGSNQASATELPSVSITVAKDELSDFAVSFRGYGQLSAASITPSSVADVFSRYSPVYPSLGQDRDVGRSALWPSQWVATLATVILVVVSRGLFRTVF